MEVADWLRTLELDQYAAQFRDNDITGDLLPNLTADDLRDLGVTSIGHRRRLLDAIALLRKTNVDGLANAEQLLTESRETGPGERRQVTVLFADLTGYTELSKLLDAEEIEGILTAFFEVADTAIVERGGIIDKHIGDCVMAVFGAPVAHGNDAERAVLAALRIRESVPMLCKRLGRDIGVHVGVASGEVLASQVGSARHKAYTVTGESVNLASRLTDHARSGEILLSSAVYRGVQDRLDCEDVGDIDVKGFVSPVRAWRLLRTRDAPVLDRAFRGTGKRTRSVCGRNGNMRRNPSRPRHLRARRGWPRQNTAHRGISAQRPSERLRLPQRSGPRFRRRKWTRRGERGDQGKVGAMVRIDQG
jgi:class 3 adenylate cyclase